MAILIIDDFQEEREFLRAVLDKAGYGPVVTAGSGQEALELMGLSGRRVTRCEADVILMDWLMPEMDGPEVCRRIRAIEHLEHVPIIMITVKSEAADLQAAYTAGATDFLRKPVMPIELVARVSTALSLKQELDARHAREMELMQKTAELEKAYQDLKNLRGLIAICAKCKRVRTDGSYRKRIEDFLEQHLDAKIERDVCPTCMGDALSKAG
jgi:phosphoserine phosphatase RsbU/P